MSPEGDTRDSFRALLLSRKTGCWQMQHHFGKNQELLKENLLLNDITILIQHYTGSDSDVTVSAAQ
jgi:hypothetical protein